VQALNVKNHEQPPSQAEEEHPASLKSPRSVTTSGNKQDCSCKTERESQAKHDDKMASYLRILAGVNKRSGIW